MVSWQKVVSPLGLVPAVQEATLVQAAIIGSSRQSVMSGSTVQLAALTQVFGQVVRHSVAPAAGVHEAVADQSVQAVWQSVATPTVKGDAGDCARELQEATSIHGLAAEYWHCRVGVTVQEVTSTHGLGHVG